MKSLILTKTKYLIFTVVIKCYKMSKLNEESDDEAPESISFGKSREEALTVLREAAELSKGTYKDKKVKGEKRKRRQERKDEKIQSETKIRNEEKLNSLREKAKEALSEDLTKIENQKSRSKNSKKVFVDEDETSDKDECDEDNFIALDSSKPRTKRTSRELTSSGSSNIRVQMVSTKKPKVLAAESVLNFRETMLYGAGSKVKRENSKLVLARKQKVKLIGSDILCSR